MEDIMLFNKIREGDNTAWGLILKGRMRRIKYHLMSGYRGTLLANSIDDAISEALIYTWLKRQEFNDMNHMLNSFYTVARIYLNNEHRHYNSKIVAIDDVMSFLSDLEFESANPWIRLKQDSDKDEKLKKIKSSVKFLPEQWRNTVALYINHGRMSSLRRHFLKEKKMVITQLEIHSQAVFDYLKTFFQTKYESITDEQASKIDRLISRMSPFQKKVIKLAMQGKQVRDIMAIVEKPFGSVRDALDKLSKKILSVAPQPILSNKCALSIGGHNAIRYLTTLKDEKILAILRKYITDADESSWVFYASRKIDVPEDVVNNIILMRDTMNLSMRAIAKKLNYGRKIVADVYNARKNMIA